MLETINNPNGESDENINTSLENMEEAKEPKTLPRAIDVSRDVRNSNGNKLLKLDEVKPMLDEMSQRFQGMPVEMVFQGHVIRSDMSEDEIYLEVLGHIKNPEDQQALELAEQKREEMLKKAEAEAPRRIEEGKPFIYTEKQREWEEYVTSGARDLYFGKNLDSALSIMPALEHGQEFRAVDKLIEQSYLDSDTDPGAILKTVFLFSKKGPEFYQWLLEDRGHLTKEKHKEIAEQKLRNAQMELHDIELNGQ